MSEQWALLHKRAINHNGSNDTLFLMKWEAGIPNPEGHRCRCKIFYHTWKRSNPPNYTDYFGWSVRLHNAINAKLGKPIIPLEIARSHWASLV